ncbi:hypothetical protein BDZ89DRAFT_519878 [Hymenopellis radicata]|nr:hypothetical protein BDZ89DRAFT_519878 [Hymenopellis radicata]
MFPIGYPAGALSGLSNWDTKTRHPSSCNSATVPSRIFMFKCSRTSSHSRHCSVYETLESGRRETSTNSRMATQWMSMKTRHLGTELGTRLLLQPCSNHIRNTFVEDYPYRGRDTRALVARRLGVGSGILRLGLELRGRTPSCQPHVSRVESEACESA